MKKVNQSIYAKNRLNRATTLCCNFWGVDPELVLTKTRDSNVMNAKHSIRYMLTLDTKLTLADIGGLTNCDHSNVLHSKKTFCDLADTSIDYAAMNRVILVDDINNKQDILRTTVSDIILSDSTTLNQVNLICELVKRS
tara:strand:+ start:363 stop:779 length:417 start_codon:yes stop_codon:yes gene_type:complete